MSQYLITSKAQPGVCPVKRCGEPVIAGVSQGQTVRCDPYPTSRDIEVAALLAGRETYSLHEGCLVRRLGNSQVSGAVLISHRCGFVLHPEPGDEPIAQPEAFVPPF